MPHEHTHIFLETEYSHRINMHVKMLVSKAVSNAQAVQASLHAYRSTHEIHGHNSIRMEFHVEPQGMSNAQPQHFVSNDTSHRVSTVSQIETYMSRARRCAISCSTLDTTIGL
jgi:hypothetical protein